LDQEHGLAALWAAHQGHCGLGVGDTGHRGGFHVKQCFDPLKQLVVAGAVEAVIADLDEAVWQHML